MSQRCGPGDEEDNDGLQDDDADEDLSQVDRDELQDRVNYNDDKEALEELNQRTGDEAYPNGRDDD